MQSTLLPHQNSSMDVSHVARALRRAARAARLGLWVVAAASLYLTLSPAAILHAQDTTTFGAGSGRATFAATAPATAPVAGRSGTTGASGGRSARGGSEFGGVSPLEPGNGPTCSFDATIYDVRVSPDQIGRVDLDALTHAAATPAGFETALRELGKMRPLYRVYQSVRLAGDTIQIGAQTPYITNSRKDQSGETVNSVAYNQIGASFNLAGKPVTQSSIELDLRVSASIATDGGAMISSNVQAPLFRNASMSHKGIVDSLQPFVAASIDGASVDADGKAIALIARVIVGEPRSAFPAPAARPVGASRVSP